MKVVVDTNILFPLKDALTPEHVPQGLRTFLGRLAERGGVLVIPETVVLEISRLRSEALQARRDRLSKAYALLSDHGLALPDVDWDELLSASEPTELLEAAGGIELQIVQPSEAQLREAHRRACLRLEPHSGKGKSDEMRDLVIWCVALDVARENGGAILLSEDQLLTNPRGDREASEAQLTRVSTLDDALDALGVDGPAEAAIRAALMAVWDEVRASGLDAPNVEDLDITPLSFRNDDRGLVVAGHLSSRPGGRGFATRATLTVEQSHLRSLHLEGISLDDVPWRSGTLDLKVNAKTELRVPDQTAQREYLRRLTTQGGAEGAP